MPRYLSGFLSPAPGIRLGFVLGLADQDDRSVRFGVAISGDPGNPV